MRDKQINKVLLKLNPIELNWYNIEANLLQFQDKTVNCKHQIAAILTIWQNKTKL